MYRQDERRAPSARHRAGERERTAIAGLESPAARARAHTPRAASARPGAQVGEPVAVVRAPRRRDALALQLLLRAAGNLVAGTLDLTTPDGLRHRFQGAAPGPAAALVLHDMTGLGRMLVRGDTGFAEAFMDGGVDTPDLEALLELGALNESHLARSLGEKPWFRLLQRLAHAWRSNTRLGSRRNIAHHYDLGNDFYRLWLDASMTYSSAVFEHHQQALGDAQRVKNERLLSLLDPRAGDHVLEIGCGWGGFALEAARRGCRVTGVTLSREQYEFARARVREHGLEERVDIRLEDYRDLRGSFDHIASVEMFEAVGEAYWRTWFDVVRARLRPGGRAAVQVITIDEPAFESYRRGRDFIQRYIFPGGMLPTPSLFAAGAQAVGLRTEACEFFAGHYARTLECWHARVLGAQAAIRALGFDERFVRMWRYYLAYCRAGFVTGRVDLMQTLLTRTV